ncbi:MAG: ABC transporter ATP-binding protein [Spirochaetales bacterium]|nr:MAG: ABC transporter ATP-binding protein [Spirochaetales bacterium]
MLKLVRYLKPYLSQVALIVLLLFLQANMDLALPDYMSRIVNNGIQQGGIDSPVPRAIRAQEMDRVLLFMTQGDRAAVKLLYVRYDTNFVDASNLVEMYPILATEPVFVLVSKDAKAIQAARKPMSQALLAASAVQQIAANPAAAQAIPGMDLSRLPLGTDVFTALANLPPDQIDMIKGTMLEQFSALGEKMLEQSAIRSIRAEYQAIGMDPGKLQNGYILSTGVLMLLLTLISVAATITVGYLGARTAAGIARTLRRDVFRKVESFSGIEFDKFSTATLITRSTNDITQIQMVVFMTLRMVIYAPIMGVGGVIRALGKAPSMAWIIGIAVLVMLVMIAIVFIIAMPKFRSIQMLVDRLNRVARENLTGLMVVRAFNRQKFEKERFDGANTDLTRVNLFVIRVMVIMMPFMMLIMNVLSVSVIWVGAHKIAESTMQVGDMMAFLQYAMQIVMSFLMLSMIFIFLPRASVSGDRIAEVLGTELSIHDPEVPENLPSASSGRVEFRNVSFRYPGADTDALSGISFTAEPGQTTAIIGPTGSGKSTTVNLIPRFYDVTGGQILVDGVDIRKVTQHELRTRIGYVPQKSVLFSGSVATNLRYGAEDATEERVALAVKTAQASAFVAEREGGYEAKISQAGANISGGQKQRLSIARALVMRYPVYIFDDSFSALDFRTDAALRRALKDTMAASTLIIVAQRVSTIMTADQIIVLDEGRIVGKGSHKELMSSCEPYRETVLSQLSSEDIA